METSTNKILISNYSDNNEKNRNAIDIVELKKFCFQLYKDISYYFNNLYAISFWFIVHSL